MADIELVIKIPEEMYTQIIDENGIDTMLITYKDIIKNGKPLPKGHGDLIDRKDLLRLESKWYHLRNSDVACPKIDIEHAQAIIEADKAESEDKE